MIRIFRHYKIGKIYTRYVLSNDIINFHCHNYIPISENLSLSLIFLRFETYMPSFLMSLYGFGVTPESMYLKQNPSPLLPSCDS